MRKLTYLGVALLLSLSAIAQNTIIQIMENHTAHLIFPADIIYTDIGDNQNYIVDYTNNVLRVKGAKTDKQTNLTVLTKDQHFYSFFVMYFENPQLNYFITTRMAIKVLGNADNKSPPALPTNTKSTAATRKVNLPTRSNSIKQETPSGINPNLYQKAVTLLGEPHLYDYIGARHAIFNSK